MGVGVWGESNGNGSSAGAGVYGNASNNNFGVLGHSNSYPGVYAKTNGTGNAALQIASGSNSVLNPAIYSVGSAQFDCSNSVAPAVHINNVGGEPSITPTSADYGYVGTTAYYWYRMQTTTSSKRNQFRTSRKLSLHFLRWKRNIFYQRENCQS